MVNFPPKNYFTIHNRKNLTVYLELHSIPPGSAPDQSHNLCRSMLYMNGEIGIYYTTYLTFNLKQLGLEIPVRRG
jgi:hypothetical protein